VGVVVRVGSGVSVRVGVSVGVSVGVGVCAEEAAEAEWRGESGE